MRLWLAGFLLCVGTLGYAEPGVEPAQELAAHLGAIQSFRATFEQDIRGGVVGWQRQVGSLVVAKPAQLRWEVVQPDPTVLVVSDGNMWLYDEVLEEVVVRALDEEELLQTPFTILAGDVDRLLCDFAVSKQNDWFILTPKRSDSTLVDIRLLLPDGELRAITLNDATEQNTQIRFSDITVNGDIDPRQFVF